VRLSERMAEIVQARPGCGLLNGVRREETRDLHLGASLRRDAFSQRDEEREYAEVPFDWAYFRP